MDDGVHTNIIAYVRRGIPLLVGGIPFAVKSVQNILQSSLTDRTVQFLPVEIFYKEGHDERYLFSSFQLALFTLHPPDFKVDPSLPFFHIKMEY